MIRYASSDPLMGVLNRRVIWEQGQQYLAEPSQVDGDFAVFMIDVDHFKWIKDRWGHDGGDRVLAAVAEALKHHVRANDIFARVGGEEFIRLIHQMNPVIATETTERSLHPPVIERHQNLEKDGHRRRRRASCRQTLGAHQRG